MFWTDIVVNSVFAVDIMINFRKAYIHPKTGATIQDPKKIAARYLKFYFWVDFIACLPLDTIFTSSFLRFSNLLKIFRLSRFNSIIRLLSLTSENTIKVKMALLVLALLVFIHWTSCLLYVVIYQNYKELALGLIDSEDPSEYFINKSGKRVPVFKFNYWVP